MWATLSHFILRQRVPLLIIILLLTGFMGWYASKHLELSYKYARVLPEDDEMAIAYEEFKAKYGEDGNVMLLTFQDSNMFQLDKYQGWYDLTDQIRKIKGVQDVMSTAKLYNIVRDDDSLKFDIVQVVQRRPETQEEVDSIKRQIFRLPFYEGLILNKETMATVMVITFTQEVLHAKDRIAIVNSINQKGTAYAEKYNIPKTGVDCNLNGILDDAELARMHFSGMPHIRTQYMQKIGGEMRLFLFLSIGVTALILFIFFRYFNATFFSLVVVIVGLVFSLGTMALFGYKITVLTGMIPSLIVIIGIPNCIFLINKYQEEYSKHGHKTKALARMVQKVGLSNFLANMTTAIGFGVFYFTKSDMLVEFGVTAAVNVMITYFVALFLTPIIFSYLPAPKAKQVRHLEGKRIQKTLSLINDLVHNHRKKIYLGVAILTIISFIGFKFISVVGYVVDDLPKNEPMYVDLKFFEKHFNGILPFEIALQVKPRLTDSIVANAKRINPDTIIDKKNYAKDTLGPRNLFDHEGEILKNIDSLQRFITAYPVFSKPISIVEVLKFSYQAYKDGKPKAYRLPNNVVDLKALADYSGTVKNQQGKLNAFIDSSRMSTRISIQMADVGSDSAAKIASQIRPVVDSLFPADYYKVDLTGHSLMFLRSFDYLVHHLFVSLSIAILLILLIGMALFRSVAIIVLSKLPCLIPLVMTAGIMGYCGIPFKSSTILIFSIAFGIASDGTIYILTEYRQQLRKLSVANASKAVENAIHETGLSMIYTNVILFFGFAIFIFSGFGGTVALGILLSITLLVSLVTNLVLLPCILLSLEKWTATRALLKEPLIEIYDEEEDIDSDKLTIQQNTEAPQ
jgi:predicted RND superfamily exporter protein